MYKEDYTFLSAREVQDLYGKSLCHEDGLVADVIRVGNHHGLGRRRKRWQLLETTYSMLIYALMILQHLRRT